ncbi:MAG: hypothetical protein ACK4UQ_08225 [Brevundimonas sp.]
MTPNDTDSTLPHTISKAQAWSAFDDVFSGSNWRLLVESLDPVSLKVDHDEHFAAFLCSDFSWMGRDQARAWISNRILQLASSYDKTHLRRLSLQLPTTKEGSVAEALLSNLERRIRDAVLEDLVTHFDTSIFEWEREVQVEAARLDDPHVRWQVSRFVGLDQVVSVDAARKAIRFVFSRTHWFLKEVNGVTAIEPDWRFDQVRALRTSLDEQTRARSLVARCIETLVEEHAREQRAGIEVAPMTRLRLKAEVERRFAEKRCWGLIELALPRDRSRHYLRAPGCLGDSLRGLLEKQEERMGLR